MLHCLRPRIPLARALVGAVVNILMLLGLAACGADSAPREMAQSTQHLMGLAELTNPTHSGKDVDTRSPVTWTCVPASEAYYLYVGTTKRARDLIDSGELSNTQYPAASLLPGQLVYVRLWTKLNGVWRYNDSSFTTAGVGYLVN